MYDSVFALLPCSICGGEEMREVQIKRFDCVLARYGIGDMVQGASDGLHLVEGLWGCNVCGIKSKEAETRPAFVRVFNGCILDVVPAGKENTTINHSGFIAGLKRAAAQATERRELMSRLYLEIQRARQEWRALENEDSNELLRIRRKIVGMEELIRKIEEELGSALPKWDKEER